MIRIDNLVKEPPTPLTDDQATNLSMFSEPAIFLKAKRIINLVDLTIQEMRLQGHSDDEINATMEEEDITDTILNLDTRVTIEVWKRTPKLSVVHHN